MTSKASRGRPAPAQAALLLGGSSDIGSAVLQALLPPYGSQVVLAGRPSPRRTAVAEQLAPHRVHLVDWDAAVPPDPASLLATAAQLCGRPLDLVLLAVGELGGRLTDQGASSPSALRRALSIDLVEPAGVLLAAVQHLASAGGGRVVVLTSASAVRPRAGIAAYSVAKQGLDRLARLCAREAALSGVQVHVVRPGHVRTAMTVGLPTPPLTRTAPQVAHDVARGVEAGRLVIWSPPVMRIAMGVLRAVPRGLLPRDLI